MKRDKYIFFYFISILLLVCIVDNRLLANNIQISNVQIIEKNSSAHWANIQFDLSYDNAWRINTGASNWCAAWVFVKFRIDGGAWKHATLSTNDAHHLMPLDITGDAASDGKGLFVYDGRIDAGIFNFSANGVVIRWNYGTDLVSDIATNIDIKIFGIEMVYIPTGSFNIGTMGSEVNSFYYYTIPGVYLPYQVGSENAISIGTSLLGSDLYYKADDLNSGDRLGPIGATFPKGYNKFYLMRYEISQQQYVDFLNTLSRPDQNTRTNSNVSVSTINNNFVLSNTNSVVNRNAVSCPKTGNGTTNPINFYCDYNGDGIGNELNDGQTIACGYLIWADGLAYLDWAGLRPMTELEFEKACRGIAGSVPNEYAWGNIIATQTISPIINSGQSSEMITNSGDGLANFDETQVGLGPLRCGFAATASTNRVQSGSGFYGILNLSDNLTERCVTVGSPEGRSFIGTHGDGSLTTDPGWPNVNGQSARGGNYLRQSFRMCISNRSFGVDPDNSRWENWGWRGARTAE